MSPLDLCPSCQAPHAPEEAICWMCGQKFWKDPNAPLASAITMSAPPPPAPAPEPRRPAAPRPFAPPPSPEAVEASARESAAAMDRWTQPVLVFSFLLVLAGLAAGKGGGGALLLLGLLPALLVLALSGLKPTLKKPEGPLEWVVWAAAKLAGVVAVMILAAMAIAAALFMACMAILAALGALK